MGLQTEPPDHQPINPVAHFLQSTTSNLLSLFASGNTSPSHTQQPSRICFPITFTDLPKPLLPTFSHLKSAQPDSVSSKSKSFNGISSAESSSGFPSTVRIAGLNSNGKAGGPAFVGQVFSMCDLSGTGLMAVSTHFDIPFISKRTPEWVKKMFAAINKSHSDGPIFRFFMDLGDAVSYIKRLNIPSGVVGACRLGLAFEHYKEKPELFQFVPNEKQVKAANKLLKETPQTGGSKKIDGVPVFSAQNLDIAIATADGIKCYTPYFFDKNMLDNILEESVDQHFQALIQTRHMQRRRDVVDDSLAADVVEELGDSLWEPPEVQEAMVEIGQSGIPFSVISKAAEMQLLYSVDRVLLGNRWLRKTAGIQPKFPYLVDSFEKRSAASFLRTSQSIAHCETEQDGNNCQNYGTVKDNVKSGQGHRQSSFFPFGNWFGNLGSKYRQTEDLSEECVKQSLQPSPFLPKITMVGVSMGEAGQMSRASLEKTMDDMTRELEEAEQGNPDSNNGCDLRDEYRDPLFVANVGDYYSGLAKSGSGNWVRGGNN